MADNVNMQHKAQAQEVYRTLIKTLDGMNCKYRTNEARLYTEISSADEKFTLHFAIVIEAEEGLINFYSPFPFVIPVDKRSNASIAVCHINRTLSIGRFDIDWRDGKMSFLLNSSFHDCSIGGELFKFMIISGIAIVNRYINKFYMLSNGTMTLQDFIMPDNS